MILGIVFRHLELFPPGLCNSSPAPLSPTPNAERSASDCFGICIRGNVFWMASMLLYWIITKRGTISEGRDVGKLQAHGRGAGAPFQRVNQEALRADYKGRRSVASRVSTKQCLSYSGDADLHPGTSTYVLKTRLPPLISIDF
jgi:hypothetical protein